MELLRQIQNHFVKKKWSLATAESCTGGGLSYKLVTVPDASHYFLGGVVAYSNDSKKELLGVSEKTLQEFGAVSEQVALEMAVGAQRKFHTTHAIAITGIAGPSGGTPQKGVGTVCFATVAYNEKKKWTSHFSGPREKIMDLAIEEACVKLAILYA